MLNNEQIEEAALDWAIDYKPWEQDLDYREYASHGFIRGYERARQDILRDLGLTEVQTRV